MAIHKEREPSHPDGSLGQAEALTRTQEGNAIAQYLHEANCYLGFLRGFERWLLIKPEVSRLPLPWQSFRPRGRGSLLTQKLAKQELLENTLASGD